LLPFEPAGCTDPDQTQSRFDLVDIMGCVSSVPAEKCTTLTTLPSSSTSDDSYSRTIEEDTITDDEMNRFVAKYKLQSIADSIFSEGISMDFLLSQDDITMFAIAQELTDNVIQRNKFMFAVRSEKEKVSTVRIYIANSETAEVVPVDVSMCDTIESVKLVYLQKANCDSLHVEDLSLMYCGATMENERTLQYYGVIPESEVLLKVHPNDDTGIARTELSVTADISRNLTSTHSNSDVTNKMCIFVHMQMHRKCVLKVEVTPATKIKKLQREIERKWGITISNQRLMLNNHKLQRNRRVRDYCITEGATIYLTKQLGLYSVFLTIMLHRDDESQVLQPSSVPKSITIGFEKSDTIHKVKQQIQLYWQVPVLQQRLFHIGEQLEEDFVTIKWLRIHDGDVLHLYEEHDGEMI